MVKRFPIVGASKRYKFTRLPAANLKKHKPLPTKLTFVTKSKIFKVNPQHTIAHAEPIAKRDIASAIARRRETRSHIALTKKVEDAYKRTIAKPQKANQLKQLQAKKTRALTRAFTLSQKRGMKTLEKTSKKLDVNIKRFGSQRTKSYAGISPSEAKQLGFPPKEVSSEMKAFYAESKPKALTKRYFKTYQKVKEKFYPGKKRSELKAFWKGKVKAELKQAKIDRAIFRDTTVQKATSNYTVWTKPGFVSKPKPVIRTRYKTISSPEKTFDVYTKRWK